VYKAIGVMQFVAQFMLVLKKIPTSNFLLFNNGIISAFYLNTTPGVPREQRFFPPTGVDARNVQDMLAAVMFVGRYSVKLVVTNTTTSIGLHTNR
jgi:hypothetical protein